MKPPPHIVKNKKRYRSYKYRCFITGTNFKTDADLTDYLATYNPMVYWTSWENHLNKKQLKLK